MTIQEAIDRVRTIQRNLESGHLRVPYPPEVRKAILQCGAVFMAHATSVAAARDLVERLTAPEPVTAELPW